MPAGMAVVRKVITRAMKPEFMLLPDLSIIEKPKEVKDGTNTLVKSQATEC
jgi:hypothetical protein